MPVFEHDVSWKKMVLPGVGCQALSKISSKYRTPSLLPIEFCVRVDPADGAAVAAVAATVLG